MTLQKRQSRCQVDDFAYSAVQCFNAEVSSKEFFLILELLSEGEGNASNHPSPSLSGQVGFEEDQFPNQPGD